MKTKPSTEESDRFAYGVEGYSSTVFYVSAPPSWNKKAAELLELPGVWCAIWSPSTNRWFVQTDRSIDPRNKMLTYVEALPEACDALAAIYHRKLDGAELQEAQDYQDHLMDLARKGVL